MKQTALIIFLLLGAFQLKAQQTASLLDTPDSLFEKGEYAQSAAAYDHLFSVGLADVTATQYYQAAVSFSLIGNADKAVKWLVEAVDEGYDDVYLTAIRFDLNFYPIKHTEAWKRFLQFGIGHFEAAAADIEYPELRNELLELWQSDQYYRQLIFGRYGGRPPNEVGAVTEAVDRYNAVRLEQMVEEIGLPTYDKVGKDGAHAAWNIVQHAVFNPPFMGRYLREMKTALEAAQVDGVDYAYLYDRFQAVCYLGKQDYGIVRRVPIRDEHLLRERRQAVGFDLSMEEYLGAYSPVSEAEYLRREAALARKYEEELALGQQALAKADFEAALGHYAEVMKCNGYIQTEDIYVMAQLQGRLNTRRSRFQAVRYLRCLAARGFGDVERLRSDSAFGKLLGDKGFEEVLGVMEKYNAEGN